MEPRQVRSAADARAIVAERALDHVKVGAFDIDGILRGKYMSAKKFDSALDGGFGFCDVVLGWDSKDQLYDNVRYTGWHTGYPDADVRVLPESCRSLPWEEPVLFFLGEFSGQAEKICPRGLLRRVLERGRRMGYQLYAGFEYEFFVFDETPDSVRAKHYRDLKPIAPDYFGYSVIRNSVWSDLYRDLLESCEKMDLPIEGLHEETGPGVMEAALAADDGLAAADKAALFKTFAKIIAQRRGLMATFMAKWSPDWPGQSGHIHMSLRDPAGRPLFHDGGAAAWHQRPDALVPRRAAAPDARTAGHGRADRQLLHEADTRLLGADRFELVSGQSHDGAAGDRREPEGAAHRIPCRGGGRESLRDPLGGRRIRTVGDREPRRAGADGQGQRLRPQVPEAPGAAAQPRGGRVAAQAVANGARMVR